MVKKNLEKRNQIARRALRTALILVLATSAATAVGRGRSMEVRIPPSGEILARLHREHPRLLATGADFARLKQRIAADPLLGRWHKALRERAERFLTEAPSRYEIPDGLRLLGTSRRVLDRVYTLALLYRLDKERKYADRAWQELQAAAGFPDWNPRHFLDTAEMTHAFAIGYDWLYDALEEEQRAALRAAILEKGLRPALTSYRGEGTYGWWVKSRHNWNQVCNGGIGMGALAIGDAVPETAGEVLHAALQSLRLPMAQFAPDGAWDEGPGYWNYATSYNTIFLAALETALGTDFGFSRTPGFAETGFFPIYLTGPLGQTFNYADGGEGRVPAPQMFWLARTLDRPVYAWYQRQVASPAPLDLLWLDPRGESPRATGLALDRHFRGVEVATFRSAWEDRDALFVGFKAGDNKANHSNLDLGSFVLDALGTRWAVDLGADNYNLPGYFGRQRWSYYRMRAEGHNTLVLNPGAEPDQDPAAAASITAFRSTPEKASAIADLTAAYARHARRVKRGVALLERRHLLVQDEVQAEEPADVWWFLHTPAEPQVSDDGAAATLKRGEQRLWLRILSPQGARFTVTAAQPLPSSPRPEGQAKNDGIRKLAIHRAGVTDLRLAVLLAPLRPGEAPPTRLPEVAPLAKW
jgi:hypothetical protein